MSVSAVGVYYYFLDVDKNTEVLSKKTDTPEMVGRDQKVARYGLSGGLSTIRKFTLNEKISLATAQAE